MNDHSDHHLLSSIRCALCDRPVDRWQTSLDMALPHVLMIEVWCHGETDTRAINLADFENDRREGRVVEAVAFDRGSLPKPIRCTD